MTKEMMESFNRIPMPKKISVKKGTIPKGRGKKKSLSMVIEALKNKKKSS